MARMNRPAPVEITYKNMRFLITHNPSNSTLNKFVEVRLFCTLLTLFLSAGCRPCWEVCDNLLWLLTGAEEVRRNHRGEGLRGHLRHQPGAEGRDPGPGESEPSNLLSHLFLLLVSKHSVVVFYLDFFFSSIGQIHPQCIVIVCAQAMNPFIVCWLTLSMNCRLIHKHWFFLRT